MSVERPEQVSKLTRRDHQRRLEAQGLNFIIPERYKRFDHLPDQVTINTLTGLALETDPMEFHMAGLISDAVRKGKKWVFIGTDADNVKYANDFLKDRALGDMDIIYGVAKPTQAVEKALAIEGEVREGIDIVALRARDAADETLIGIFGLSDEEIERIQREMGLASEPTPTTNPNFTFSVSTSVIAYNDERIQDVLATEAPWIAGGNVSRRLYSSIKDLADADVKLDKRAKDLARLPIAELLRVPALADYIHLSTVTIGNTRISDDLLEIYGKLTSIQALREMSKHPRLSRAFELLLFELGIPEEQLANLTTPEQIQAAFAELFGQQEEQGGDKPQPPLF